MKTKHILFTIALFFSVTFIDAQDKYEFMVIEYNTFNGKQLSVSIDGLTFITEEINLQKNENEKPNANPILKKVKEYQDQNWELIGFQSSFGQQNSYTFRAHFAHLKRKIK